MACDCRTCGILLTARPEKAICQGSQIYILCVGTKDVPLDKSSDGHTTTRSLTVMKIKLRMLMNHCRNNVEYRIS